MKNGYLLSWKQNEQVMYGKDNLTLRLGSMGKPANYIQGMTIAQARRLKKQWPRATSLNIYKLVLVKE